jgi:hypothetical protein
MKASRSTIMIVSSIALGFALAMGAGSAGAQQQAEQEENIHFLWAFGAVVKAASGSKLVPIARDTAMKSGDQIKIFVKVEKKCFIYVVYHSSQGELSVLFPYRFEQLGTDEFTAGQYYIPQGDEWFELDEHVGQETFYLLASAKRLHELEALINKYESADPAKKTEFANKILVEIRRLRWEHRKFKSFAEKPVSIMGQLRGSEKVDRPGKPDVASLAVEISGQNFYSRTFTIDHQ